MAIDVTVTVWCGQGDHETCLKKDYFMCKCTCHIRKLVSDDVDWVK